MSTYTSDQYKRARRFLDGGRVPFHADWGYKPLPDGSNKHEFAMPDDLADILKPFLHVSEYRIKLVIDYYCGVNGTREEFLELYEPSLLRQRQWEYRQRYAPVKKRKGAKP